MKSGIRDLLFLIVAIVLAVIIVPFILKLAFDIIRIVVIIAFAYVFFIILKQLLK